MNKVKVIKIAVPACICAVALIILAAVLMNGKDSKTWKDYYDLGMQYLKEENYEEAAKRLREHLQESLQELDKYRKNPMNIISNLIKD